MICTSEHVKNTCSQHDSRQFITDYQKEKQELNQYTL